VIVEEGNQEHERPQCPGGVGFGGGLAPRQHHHCDARPEDEQRDQRVEPEEEDDLVDPQRANAPLDGDLALAGLEGEARARLALALQLREPRGDPARHRRAGTAGDRLAVHRDQLIGEPQRQRFGLPARPVHGGERAVGIGQQSSKRPATRATRVSSGEDDQDGQSKTDRQQNHPPA